MYTIIETEDFKNWFQALTKKEQALTQDRLSRIKLDGHFGIAKKLGKHLAELKWKNGQRVYFSLIKDANSKRIILLLIGGNKNSQDKDIKRAKKLITILGREDS